MGDEVMVQESETKPVNQLTWDIRTFARE